MYSALDLSIVASGALAVAWAWRGKNSAAQESMNMDLQTILIRFLLTPMKDYCPAIAFVFLVQASSSTQALLDFINPMAMFSTVDPDDSGWLGRDELDWHRKMCLIASLAIWRAEKMESLLVRMERSFKILKQGDQVSQLCADPFGYCWPPLWGWTRRIAHVVVSSLGVVPFLHVAYPFVVVDEFLWWAFPEIFMKFSRNVYPLPTTFDIIILPIIDLMHFVPVIFKIFFLGIVDYARYDTQDNYLLLVVCALAWTAHNCHLFYMTALVDIPGSYSALYAQ